MKKEGYAGAGEMRQFVEYLWGWNATVTGLVDAKMWQETFEVYVQDKHKLGMKEFFEKNSPFAYQDMTARMVETVRKGYWKADAATEKKLLSEYMQSVNQHGVGCAAHTCGNPRLSKYVMDRAKAMGIPVPSIEGFQRAMEKAMGTQISKAAGSAENFVAHNEAAKEPAKKPAKDSAPTPISKRQAPAANQAPSPQQLHGYLMEAKDQASRAVAKTTQNVTRKQGWEAFWIFAPVLLALFVWQRHRRTSILGRGSSG
jgi:cobaltochelatase CobN